MNLAIVIAAAGFSRRFGADKLSETTGERSVLETAVEAMSEALPEIPLVVVVNQTEIERWRGRFPGADVVTGGQRRQDSVRIGIEKAIGAGAEFVVIHDGARPLIHRDDVGRVIDSLGDDDAVILCASISDTVKRVDPSGIVLETIDRESLRLAQTPQLVRVVAMKNAWRRQDMEFEWSDEASLIEADGGRIRCVTAEHPNPKITTPADLELVRVLKGAN